MGALLDRRDVPVLAGSELIYFDSATTSLVPMQVLDAVTQYYRKVGAVGRGTYKLAAQATAMVVNARETAAGFFNCEPEEVVFTKNTTDGINLVAAGLDWNPGDRVVVTLFEHHANLLPWMKLREERGIVLDVVRPGKDGRFDTEIYAETVSKNNVKLVSFTHRSNVLGTELPAADIIEVARGVGAKTLLDAAQSAPHSSINLAEIDPDFFTMSGHKTLGPKGVGLLVVKKRNFDKLKPARLDDGNITGVTLDDYELAESPTRYEAGTYDLGAIAALAKAFKVLHELGMDRVAEHGRTLGSHLYKGMRDIPGVTVFGPEEPAERTGTCAFIIDGIKPHQAAALYDKLRNIAVRSGHHCALPLATEYLGRREGTVRASLYVYNSVEEVDTFLDVTEHIIRISKRKRSEKTSLPGLYL
jgi:cysteine desulfurase/selenocysteine lyase